MYIDCRLLFFISSYVHIYLRYIYMYVYIISTYVKFRIFKDFATSNRENKKIVFDNVVV